MRLRSVFVVLFAVACMPPGAVQAQAQAQPKPSGCREENPDCAAACALRETARSQYVEWFDQRCAAAILKKNPDEVAGATPPPKTELLDTR